MKQAAIVVSTVSFSSFLLFSHLNNFETGITTWNIFVIYSFEMIKILPLAFILIGLFEVWVKRETVEQHLGKNSGVFGYFWAILLGGTTIGPMIVSLPIAYTLSSKGARLQIVFTYIGAAAVCRIPMTILEASYLGLKFTLVRYLVSIPLIIISSAVLGHYLENNNYTIKNEEIS